jgi:uroporphyrinogen decarboxylase
VVYFANGGSGYLSQQLDMGCDALSLDWQISMKTARKIAGPETILAGNVDPMVLYTDKECIEKAVRECIQDAGGRRHVLNLGHGVEKDTPEEAVEIFVNAARAM